MQASTSIVQRWMGNVMTDLQQGAEEYARNLKQGKTPSSALQEKSS